MMPLVAILAVFGGFMAFDLDLPQSWTYIFCIIGGVVLVVGVLGFFLIEDTPRAERDGYLQTLVYSFRPSTVMRAPRLYLYLAAFVLFNISIQIFMPYLILYYEVSLGMENYVLVMAPAILLAAAVTAFYGRVYDRRGFSFSIAFSLLWLMAGYLLLFFTRTTLPVFFGSLLMMCGYLSGMAVFGAKIRDLIPAGMAGRFQGVRIAAQVLLPGVIGPFIGKTVLQNAKTLQNSDGTVSFIPNASIFLAALCAAAALLLFLLLMPRQKPRTVDLTTPFEGDADAWMRVYPRPQMRRDSFVSLCGTWQLSVKRGELCTPLGEIRVPFAPESRLSGIRRTLARGEEWVYERSFTPPRENARVLLHFGAVDQTCAVFVNRKLAGKHVGGYLPFSLDITPYLTDGENLLTVTVRDPLDRNLPYGKQRKKRGGMWYTPISGIWQPVWLESVPHYHFRSMMITPKEDTIRIFVKGGGEQKTLTLGDEVYTFLGNVVEFTPRVRHLWTPEDPYLYEFTLTDGTDTVHSYFAWRTVGTLKCGARQVMALNGKPYFFHGLLDQGYFPDGIYTPASPDGYLADIRRAKELGFNMLRKHIKIEPELFYYYCDKYGIALFQDLVNSGRYSFLLDTALPTVGIRRGIRHKASKRQFRQFRTDARATLYHLYNHPSVISYTIFNEGWGQHDADRYYCVLKRIEKVRPLDTASGWFKPKRSDFESEHIYFKRIDLRPKTDRALFLSEFGGYSLRVDGHVFNIDKAYGYRTYRDPAALTAGLSSLYLDEVLPQIERNGLSAAVLTQLSDVEDEINGLLTYDRQIVKVDRAELQKIAAALFAAFDAYCKKNM